MYDGDAILLEFDGADVLQARYTHGEEIDQPLSMARGGVSYFYGVDHLTGSGLRHCGIPRVTNGN